MKNETQSPGLWHRAALHYCIICAFQVLYISWSKENEYGYLSLKFLPAVMEILAQRNNIPTPEVFWTYLCSLLKELTLNMYVINTWFNTIPQTLKQNSEKSKPLNKEGKRSHEVGISHGNSGVWSGTKVGEKLKQKSTCKRTECFLWDLKHICLKSSGNCPRIMQQMQKHLCKKIH